jgi:hypothetical protein
MKLVIRKLDENLAKKRAAKPLPKKRIRGPDGELVTLVKLDMNSPNFGSDLQRAFARNVRQARRDNKHLSATALAKRSR